MASGPLDHSIALIDAALALPAMAFATSDDGLDLDLPGLGRSGAGRRPSVQGLRALAALYLQSELEVVGLITVAELLSDERHWLPVTSAATARRLERFALARRQWLDEKTRQMIFARAFGSGAPAPGTGGLVNRAFQQHMADLCVALLRYTGAGRFGAPGQGVEIRLRHAIDGLLANLAPREYGNTVNAARNIQSQLKASLELLADPAIGSLFGARGVWDTLRRILGSEAPDIARYVDRGQSGLRLLEWLATLPATPASVRLEPNPSTFVWASTWLDASGMGK